MNFKCLFGHDKKYVAIRFGTWPWPGDCRRPFHRYHREDNVYIARWACQRCPKLGETCLGDKQDWMVEHGKIVADVKKWANWSDKKP